MKPVSRIATLIGACLLLAGCSGGGEPAPKGKKGSEGPVPVVVAKVERQAVPLTLAAFGHLEASASVEVKARVDGQIIRALFQEGQEVKAGDLLFELDRRTFAAQLRQAEANLARDRARREQAQAEELRYRELVAKGMATRDQFEQMQTAAKVAQAEEQSAEAAVENARLPLGYSRIRAPIGGRTGRILVQPGNLVKASDANPLVVINDTDPIRVGFSLPERQLSSVRERMTVGKLPVRATPVGTDRELVTGQLGFIDNTVDPATGMVRLRADFRNPKHSLWPGQFVNLELQLGEEADRVAVPAGAVLNGPKGHFVFVVKGENAEQRLVAVARTQGDVSIISEGLQGGEILVVSGQSRLVDGAKVAVKPDDPR